MVSTRILRSMFGLALALAITAVAHAEVTLDGDMPMDIETHSDASLGTLLSCDNSRCLWADKNGRAVGRYEMMRQLMREEELDIEEDHTERRRLESYVQYVEDVHRHAQLSGVVFGYKMGVTPRHLYLDDDRVQTPQEYVEQEFHAHQRRLLEETVKIASDQDTSRRRLDTTVMDSLDWCTTNNPLKKNVCTPVKSQSTCGSCWAFAASDAIETAVAVSSDAAPLALSPQQFLDCSRRNMTVKFDYCWAAKGVSGATWLNQTATWASRNNGCNGGMTHGAFADAAEMQLGLLSELVMPYTETTTDVTLVPGFTHKPTNTPKTEEEREKSCVKGSDNSSATINDWQQAVGKDCSTTSDIKQLLKIALQKQPISVAINSDGSFKDYKGGVYSCPNNGDFTVGSSQVNHAIVLVGYGTEGSTEYWILKNSYGFSWGEKGFIRLKMDDKINCGVAIFPVIPLGASKGAAKLYIDGGGDKVMLWLSPTVWIIIAAVTTIATTVLTAVGVVVHRRRRDAMQNKDAVMG